MGTKVAPIYATLVLAYLEEQLYLRLERDFNHQFSQYIEENFKRFLDDCFILFTKSDNELEKLYQYLNNLHPSLKFTMDSNTNQLPFLDTMVINNGGKIQTDRTTNQQTRNNTYYTHPVTRNTLEIVSHIT